MVVSDNCPPDEEKLEYIVSCDSQLLVMRSKGN